MRAYRVYVVTDDGDIAGPPHVIECADDQEAMGKAVQYTNGKAVELWDGAHLIVRFPSDDDWSHPLSNSAQTAAPLWAQAHH
jgi:hypothetical protein